MSLDKIEALEERISRVVELVKALKEEKSHLEGEIARLQAELVSKKTLEDELARMLEEKETVRTRLSTMLKGMEELDL